eukprot:scaffold64378_cov66-Attheya_sp.AAC.1
MRTHCIDSPVRAFLIFFALLINTHCSRQCSAADIDIETKAATTEEGKCVENVVNMQEQHRELIEWIRSHPDGFVNDKLEIRPADPNDPDSGSGMFVKGSVQEGEVLYSIPWDLIIKPDEFDINKARSSLLSCETAQSLLRELRLEEKSTFGPYLKYFHSFEQGGLIAEWSDAGYDLLKKVLGPLFSARSNWIKYWHETCEGGSDPLEEKAAMYVVTRAEDYLLIPLFDLANHRNGHMNYNYENKKLEVEEGVSANGIATRDIVAGEEIHHSYYLCPECGAMRTNGFGTQGMLENYGFVESMPQRWGFYFYDEDTDKHVDVLFDLDDANPAAPTGELDLRWFGELFQPDQDALDSLRKELERLQTLSQELEENNGTLESIPKFEYNMVYRFHYAQIAALTKAVQVATDDIVKKTEDDRRNAERMKNQHQELIGWIRSHPEGFVNDKLEIRMADPNDPASGSGMFVNDSIEEGEVLYSIPWDLIIKPDDFDVKKRTTSLMSCGTVRSFIREIRLGDESTFGPYLKYFHTFETGGLIEDWSEAGYNLLKEVGGTDSWYKSWKKQWHVECDGGKAPLEEKAAQYVVTRAEDYLLIPLFELANHRNGHMNYGYVNKRIEVKDGVGADGIATRHIPAGEEIHHSFYLCPDCGLLRTNGHGTIDVLRNYGFIEPMPQRWAFSYNNEDKEMDIIFDLDDVHPEAPTGELALRWFGKGHQPDQDGLMLLQEELKRLEAKASMFQNNRIIHSIPKHEFDVAYRFYEAISDALTKAIQVASEDIEEADDQIEQTWDQRGSPEEKSMKQHMELIEWIRSHPDGFVSDKLEIRVADPNNPASGSGMFVNGPVKEGELLYSLPWDLLIKADDASPGGELKTLLSCGLVRSLLRELRLGDESTFGPYLKYFHSFDSSGLVENWSEDGYDILEQISGYDWSYHFVNDIWLDHCDGSTDPLEMWVEKKAAEYVATRAEDFVLIPLFDLANHRNGHMNYAHVNKKIEVVGGVGADGIATRDIEAGEEIHHSYYLCPKCGESLSNGFGTRSLLLNYGFVESMPQRWTFYTNYDDLDENVDITFDIDYAKPGAPPGELDLRWYVGETPKDQNELIHLREELERLEEEEDELNNDDDGIPDYEYDVIRRYLEARIVAFRKAVQVATEVIGTEASRDEHDVEKDEL